MKKTLLDILENGTLTDGERALAHAALSTDRKGDKHAKAAAELLASGRLSDGDRLRVVVALGATKAAPTAKDAKDAPEDETA